MAQPRLTIIEIIKEHRLYNGLNPSRHCLSPSIITNIHKKVLQNRAFSKLVLYIYTYDMNKHFAISKIIRILHNTNRDYMKNLKKQLLSKTLGKHAYWTINKQLVKSIGLEATLILQHIIDLQSVFNKDEIFQSQSEMADELGISEYAIKNKIPELVKLGLLNVVRKGVPCKNYYTTNDDKIMDILVNQLDDTKSTNKRVDFENNLTDNMISTIQLVENDLTSEHEIATTITNNTDQETKPRSIIKNTGAPEHIILKHQLDLLSEHMDDNNIPAARNLIAALEEDYGNFNNVLEICYGDDAAIIKNWKNYYTNTLAFIN